MYDVYHIASKTDAIITDTCDIRDPNSRFAAGHSRGTKSPCCRVRDALSQDKKSLTLVALRSIQNRMPERIEPDS